MVACWSRLPVPNPRNFSLCRLGQGSHKHFRSEDDLTHINSEVGFLCQVHWHRENDPLCCNALRLNLGIHQKRGGTSG
jgi:hypothetical protein